MSNPSEHLDNTVWDPANPEQAIEDPFHGPSAIFDMLQVPAMPLGDGRYYQPGAYSTLGTPYLDARGRPVHEITIDPQGTRLRREQRYLQEWLRAYYEGGDEALVALEAQRQQSRLDATGIAHCFRTQDICPGGKQLNDCEPGNKAFDTAEAWAEQHATSQPGEGNIRNVIAWAGGTCTACAISCEASVETQDGRHAETRVTFCRPDPTMLTIRINDTLRPVAPAELPDLTNFINVL